MGSGANIQVLVPEGDGVFFELDQPFLSRFECTTLCKPGWTFTMSVDEGKRRRKQSCGSESSLQGKGTNRMADQLGWLMIMSRDTFVRLDESSLM